MHVASKRPERLTRWDIISIANARLQEEIGDTHVLIDKPVITQEAEGQVYLVEDAWLIIPTKFLRYDTTDCTEPSIAMLSPRVVELRVVSFHPV